ncbi:hypothetical protein [Streptomyces virginiae]|uniref:hypothetical protein n=1 Tax=Streptomyces virginiae TaxID=1961 RepID=UPI00331A4529
MQPASRSQKVVKKHYEDTIANPVSFEQYAHLLEPDVLDQLKQLFPAGQVQMWGIVPGQREVNVAHVKKMSAGDWVFFTGDKRLYLGGTIALMWRNPELAEELWQKNDNGQTWEYMYALSGTRGFDIPMDEKRDLDNVAMLACTFGCDALFEHGYVTVAEEGALQVSPLAAAIPEIDTHIQERLAGRTVTWWSPKREPYYQWHRTHTFKELPPA